MKKVVVVLVLGFLFPFFCMSQGIGSYSKEIKKAFFSADKKAEVVKNYRNVAIYKSGGEYFAVAFGESRSPSIARSKAHMDFCGMLSDTYGKSETSQNGDTTRICSAATVENTFQKNSETFVKNEVYINFILYEIPGKILVDGKPIDPKIILKK